MSEFWVSKKRYWCKYCGISIADDAPSRQHHESGLRHKGNVDRYIRDIYKTSEKKKKDAAEEERELKRIDAAAREAYAKDIGSGAAAASASASSSSSAPAQRAPAAKPPPPKPTDKFANYSTAESLGFVDEAVLEAQKRQTEGLAGEWQLVLPTPAPKSKTTEETEKRGLQPAQTEEKAAAESSRNFRVGERKVGAGLQEIWEPDIPIRVKVKTETQPAQSQEQEAKPKAEIDYGLPQATEKPVWKPTTWSKTREVKQEVKEEPSDKIKEEEPSPTLLPTDATSAPLPQSTPPPPPAEPPVKSEPEEPKLEEIAPPSGGGGLFRKRKAPPTTAGTRGVKKR
ncbi:U1 zinc finger [Rhizoctonia solani]|uniref:U1 zinc finger n=1 Tax=Rhizoctonia solani TaxID=456999 RepID=A0A8H7H7W6_9AGAM|nr:U1 zinc finger [Rhizoctonia solani]